MKGKKLLYIDNSIVTSIKGYKLLQLRLFYNILLKYSYKTRLKGDNSRTLSLTMKDIKISIGDSTSKTTIKEIFELVKTMPSSISYFNNEIEEGKIITLFETLDISRKGLDVKITESAAPILSKISTCFSKMSIEEFVSLRSLYGCLMYEISSRYSQQGFYSMSIEDFKAYFGIEGKESYNHIHNIDKKILIPGINDVNNNTSLNLKIQKIKKNRKITHLKFIIKGGYKKEPIHCLV